MNTTFVERLWLLINEKTQGKPTVFANKAGISSGTFDAYLNGRVPKAEQLVRIHETYGVDITWLLTGKGRPYISGALASEDETEEDPELADLLAGARKVLTSGNQLAFDALARNIQYFSHAIETERRLNAMESRVASLEEIIKQLTSSRDSNESLNEEAI